MDVTCAAGVFRLWVEESDGRRSVATLSIISPATDAAGSIVLAPNTRISTASVASTAACSGIASVGPVSGVSSITSIATGTC